MRFFVCLHNCLAHVHIIRCVFYNNLNYQKISHERFQIIIVRNYSVCAHSPFRSRQWYKTMAEESYSKNHQGLI